MSERTELITLSIPNMTSAMRTEATATTIELLQSAFQLGQVVFSVNSLYELAKYVLSFSIFYLHSSARVERFELPSTVLETAILPLNYTRIQGAVRTAVRTVILDYTN